MQIAIVGAGFSGLATAWHLLNQKNLQIIIYDEAGIGGGASGIAAGLVHPFAGAHAKLNWLGYEGWNSTCNLLEIASFTLGIPVATFSGLLRLATSSEQKIDYQHCLKKYSDIEWWDSSKQTYNITGISPLEGIFIKNAAVVDTQQYLKGLWLACEKKKAIFIHQRIENLQMLDHFDAVVIATGWNSQLFSKISTLPITPVKGQVLQLKWPNSIPQLAVPINSYAYMVMNPDGISCTVGSTYERENISTKPDIEIAISEIIPKVTTFFPMADALPILDCKAGIRASTPDHKPIIKKISDKIWVITGMGSKGLLYHSLYSERLAQMILNQIK